MLCAAIDIGSNTTRLLVAEPQEGQLRKVMEQRAYTRIGKGASKNGKINGDKVAEVAEAVTTQVRKVMEQRAYTRIGKGASKNGKITAEKVAEVAEVVTRQVRLAGEMGAEVIKIVATAAIREAKNRGKVVKAIEKEAGLAVEVLSEKDEGRLAFLGATKSLGHPVDGTVAVVDVGGGSSEVIFGKLDEGVTEVRSWKIGSGSLAEEHLRSDPPSASEIRSVRDAISDFFDGEELEHPDQAVAVGGSATSLRTLVGAVLEYETLERAVRVLSSDEIADVAKRFELDTRRVELLPAGVLILEKLSELLGQPLQIGKGGLREGVILDLLNGSANGSSSKALAA